MGFVNTVDSIGDAALTNSIIDRSITSIADNIITAIGKYAFYKCSNLSTADFIAVTSIESVSFQDCSALTALILRSETMCTLESTNAFTSTPIASGTGYIYVPAALVDSYKAATNWRTYADQIRAIEDYPEVCSYAGKVWTQSNITSGTFYAVAYADGLWVACSDSKGLYYSTDGKTWTRSNITSGDFYAVAYAGGLWVACSNDQGLYYSTDCKTWTRSNITSGDFYAAAYADGLWVACSYSSKGLYYSTDGKTWTQSNITSNKFSAAAYADGLWVACSYSRKGLYYSTDGKTWTQSNITSGDFRAVAYADGFWVACGTSGLYYSTDGKTWIQSNITSDSCYAVAYADGLWVACSYTYSKGLYYSD